MAGKRVGIGARMKFRMSIDPVSCNALLSGKVNRSEDKHNKIHLKLLQGNLFNSVSVYDTGSLQGSSLPDVSNFTSLCNIHHCPSNICSNLFTMLAVLWASRQLVFNSNGFFFNTGTKSYSNTMLMN